MRSKHDLTGIGLLFMGAALSAGTMWLFPTCDSLEDGSWMKCHWSGQATIGIGIVIAVIALAYLLFPDQHVRAGLSLAVIPVSALDIAVLNGVIGLCGRAEMQCRAVTKPAVTIINILVILIAASNMIFMLQDMRRQKGRGDEL